MATRTVFYSWQSDLPNNVCRGFVQKAIQGALREVGPEYLPDELSLDSATRGEAGAPNIAEAILRKIRRARVVVADVSLITPPDAPRPCPNPNVSVEVGAALFVPGEDRLILTMNTAFGGPEELPFDLKYRQILTYSAPPDDESGRSQQRERLSRQIAEKLRSVLYPTFRSSVPPEDWPEPELSPNDIDLAREWSFPTLSTDRDEIAWFRALYEPFPLDVTDTPYALKQDLDLRDDFSAEGLDKRLVRGRGGTALTLLGIWHADPSAPEIWWVEIVQRYLQQLVRAQPTIRTIAVRDLAHVIGLSHDQVSLGMKLSPWPGPGGQGNKVPGSSIMRYELTELKTEGAFDNILSYPGIEDVMAWVVGRQTADGKILKDR